jgi:hypothetical protein
MTTKQTQLYWREWAAVRRADPRADRLELTIRALGKARSSKEFTNAEFDRVLAAFRAVSRPADVDGQLDQQEQPRKRKEHRIAEIMACLALYHPDPAGYVATVLAGRSTVPVAGTLGLDDLSDVPTVRTRRDWTEYPGPSELEQVLMTLWSRVQPMRRRALHSLHDMRIAAGVPCDCAKICRKTTPVVVVGEPWDAAEPGAEERTEETAEEPF